MSRPRASAAQCSLAWDGVVARPACEHLARQHAERHSWTLLRVEHARGLFGPVEEAVFADEAGRERRRTVDMLRAPSAGTPAAR